LAEFLFYLSFQKAVCVMPGTPTTHYKFPLPDEDDAPDVVYDMTNLAEHIDTALYTVDSKIVKGNVQYGELKTTTNWEKYPNYPWGCIRYGHIAHVVGMVIRRTSDLEVPVWQTTKAPYAPFDFLQLPFVAAGRHIFPIYTSFGILEGRIHPRHDETSTNTTWLSRARYMQTTYSPLMSSSKPQIQRDKTWFAFNFTYVVSGVYGLDISGESPPDVTGGEGFNPDNPNTDPDGTETSGLGK
jgi:hypothetical protein